jgi:hypothetical protein
MVRFSRVVVVIAALLLVGAAPALAAGPGGSLPIHGAVLTAGPPPDMTAPGCAPGAIWRFNRVGTGTLSHLGSVGSVQTHCTYLLTPVPFRAALGGGRITFTAANRDTLVLAYEGVTDAIVDGAGGFVGYTAEGTWTVVGGTGRFLHATGSGWFDVVGDVPGGDTLFGLPDGFDRWAFKGTIAYDASDRSS